MVRAEARVAPAPIAFSGNMFGDRGVGMADVVLGHQEGAPQKRRANPTTLTIKKREKFMNALAATCNVRMSAAYSGVDHTVLYAHRLRDPVFAEQWRDALTIGCDRLEAMVLEHGGAGEPLSSIDPEQAEADGVTPPFDFDRAMRVLGYYRSNAGNAVKTRSASRAPRLATREETTKVLMKALAAAQKRLARKPVHGE